MRRNMLLLGCLVALSSCELDVAPEVAYKVTEVALKGAVEHRCQRGGHHFLTLIENEGMVTWRPHPGDDPNGWGSSLYLQPFLGAATLSGASIESIEAGILGIEVKVSGEIPGEEGQTYGNWSGTFHLEYNEGTSLVLMSGTYTVIPAGPLDEVTKDLNLYLIASSYLYDVPLLSGGTGDTGDMSLATVSGTGFEMTWIPDEEPAHYPTESSTVLEVVVSGAYHELDSAAQGYEPIEAAQKPLLAVKLDGKEGSPELSFGGQYTVAFGQDFWEDNVGIVAQVRQPVPAATWTWSVDFWSSP